MLSGTDPRVKGDHLRDAPPYDVRCPLKTVLGPSPPQYRQWARGAS